MFLSDCEIYNYEICRTRWCMRICWRLLQMNRCAKESAVTESPQIQVSLILEFPAAKEMRLNIIIPKLCEIEIVWFSDGILRLHLQFLCSESLPDLRLIRTGFSLFLSVYSGQYFNSTIRHNKTDYFILSYIFLYSLKLFSAYSWI